MQNSKMAMDTPLFLRFIFQRKIFLLMVLAISMLAGILTSMSVTKKEIAAVEVEIATLQDLSLLNYERSNMTKVRWLTPAEVFLKFRSNITSHYAQKQFTEQYGKAQAKFFIETKDAYTFKVTVASNSAALSTKILKEFLSNVNAQTLDELVQMSNKVVAQIQQKTKKEIQQYQRLLEKTFAMNTVAQNTTASTIDAAKPALSNPTLLQEKNKIKIYEGLIQKYALELATMKPVSLAPHQINLYQISNHIVVNTISPWPERFKIMGAFFILGLVLSCIVLLLMFLYQAQNERVK